MVLPQEDPNALAARTRQWREHYRPASPGAHHLLTRCVRSSLLEDRCFAYHDDVTARQVREATLRWDRELEAELDAHVGRLPTEPAAAIDGLRRTAAGCQYIVDRLGDLLSRHIERGALCASDRDEAIWLQGAGAEPGALAASPTAYRTRLLNLLSHKHPNPDRLAWMLEPDQRPDTLEEVYRAGALPSREQAQEQLRQILRERQARFREEGEWLEKHIDGPARAEAPGRAVLIQDAEKARLYLRYSAEARTGFDRAWGAFQKALECDRAEGADPVLVAEPASALVLAPSPAPLEAAAPAPVGPPEAVSRNEAKSAVEPQPSPEQIVVSDDTNGTRIDPLGETAREVPSPSLPPSLAGEDADDPGMMVAAEDAEAGCRNEPDLAVEPQLNVEEAGTSDDTSASESAAGERTGHPEPPVTPGAAGREEAHPRDQIPGDPLGPHQSPVTGIVEGGPDLLRRIVEARRPQRATSTWQGAVRSPVEAGASLTEKMRAPSHSISKGAESLISPHPCGEGLGSKSYYFDHRDLRRIPSPPNSPLQGGKELSARRSPSSSRKRRSRTERPEEFAGRGPGGT